jgi:hypothetical protein
MFQCSDLLTARVDVHLDPLWRRLRDDLRALPVMSSGSLIT